MNRLKELREKSQMNMREMAKELKMPYTTYVNYEKGVREPNSETLIELAKYFDVTVDFLIGRESPCHICGFRFFEDLKGDKKAHESYHNKCLEAIDEFGFFWHYEKREIEKQKGRRILSDASFTFEDKKMAAENICKAYFSRSLEATDFSLQHPPFKKYTAMILNQPYFRERFAEVYSELEKKYGTCEGMDNKSTYYVISNSSSKKTVSAALTDTEKKLLTTFKKLSSSGKEKVLDYTTLIYNSEKTQ